MKAGRFGSLGGRARNTRGRAVLFLFGTLALAGCFGNPPSGPDPDAEGPEAWERSPPGVAYDEAIPLGPMGPAVSPPPMRLAQNWTQLSFRTELVAQGPCGALIPTEPNRPTAEVTFESPNGTIVRATMETVAICSMGSTAPASVQVQAGKAYERGNWTVEVAGKGLGVSIHTRVTGS